MPSPNEGGGTENGPVDAAFGDDSLGFGLGFQVGARRFSSAHRAEQNDVVHSGVGHAIHETASGADVRAFVGVALTKPLFHGADQLNDGGSVLEDRLQSGGVIQVENCGPCGGRIAHAFGSGRSQMGDDIQRLFGGHGH